MIAVEQIYISAGIFLFGLQSRWIWAEFSKNVYLLDFRGLVADKGDGIAGAANVDGVMGEGRGRLAAYNDPGGVSGPGNILVASRSSFR